ncbi:MAG: WD40 repeat domain-containing protein, partial [Bacteroidota bacterium]
MAKIKTLNLHPVAPIVAACDEHGVVEVWHFLHQERLFCFDFTNQQEFLHLNEYSSDTRIAREAAAIEIGKSSGNQKDGLRLGNVRNVHLIDREGLQFMFGEGETASYSDSPEVYTFLESTILLVVLENAIVVFQLHSGRGYLIQEALQGSLPYSCCPISEHLIAIGCSDGHIRIFDLLHWVRVQTLNGHRSEVLQILSLPYDVANFKQHRVRFLSFGNDQRLILWECEVQGGGVAPPAFLTLLESPRGSIAADVVLSFSYQLQSVFASHSQMVIGWKLYSPSSPKRSASSQKLRRVPANSVQQLPFVD